MSATQRLRIYCLLLCLPGCGQLLYYDQLITGQTELLQQRRALSQVSADPAIPDVLRKRLVLAQNMRNFASQTLGLPDNESYRSYADLGRSYAIYNVFAAPELSLEPYQWCYPIIGCAAYRGYFQRDQAEREAQRLEQVGYEVYIADIPAYSTLGWFDDPLLNTFIDWPIGLVAELIFHELAHQRVYIADDTAFNEAFATAVGEIGAQLWLGERPQDAAEYAALKRYQKDFLALIFELRAQLASLYTSSSSAAFKRQSKRERLENARQRYQRLKNEQWNGFAGYERWFAADLNNAKLAPISAYHHYVPAFIRLFTKAGKNFAQFYEDVEQLGTLPPHEREQQLESLLKSSADCRAEIHCTASGLTPH